MLKEKEIENKLKDIYLLNNLLDKKWKKKQWMILFILKKNFGDYYVLIPFLDDNYTLGKKIEEKQKNGWKIFKLLFLK